MVTTVLIPAIKKIKNHEDQLDTFEKIEGRFALQAKVATLIAGIAGFYMMYEMDAWNRYTLLQFWWIHAMTIVWLIFTLVLYVLEPLVLHRLFRGMGHLIRLEHCALCTVFIGHCYS
ncbi:MAG: hypothetical protein JXQ90_20895 [Cyclobacteriaceae bacterium]